MARPPDERPKRSSPSRRRGPLFGVPYVERPEDIRPIAEPGVDRDVAFDRSGRRHYSSSVTPYEPSVDRPSSRAVLTLIFGLLAFLFFNMPYLAVPCDVLALVLGFDEIKEVRLGRTAESGRNLAIPGIILAAVATFYIMMVLLIRS